MRSATEGIESTLKRRIMHEKNKDQNFQRKVGVHEEADTTGRANQT